MVITELTFLHSSSVQGFRGLRVDPNPHVLFEETAEETIISKPKISNHKVRI